MTPPEASVGRLVVCPTPIGNLRDVTLRALDELAGAEVIACEDTRHTRRLLDCHGIAATLVSLHEHNERARAQELCERIEAGARVALVSDAGTPVVSDPGFQLIGACLRAGLPVEVLPGPSAAVTALVASGLPAERWRFVGFLPRRRGELAELFAGAQETTVAYESPRRLAASLAVLAELDPFRQLAVCRELTKIHEDVSRGAAAELAERFAAQPARGEVTIVFAQAPPGRGDLDRAVAALGELVGAGARARPAAAVLSGLTGISANELYRELTAAGK